MNERYRVRVEYTEADTENFEDTEENNGVL